VHLILPECDAFKFDSGIYAGMGGRALAFGIPETAKSLLKRRMIGAGISIANDRRSDASIGIHHEGGEERIAKVLFRVLNAERLPMMWDCFGICAGSSVAQRTANKLR